MIIRQAKVDKRHYKLKKGKINVKTRMDDELFTGYNQCNDSKDNASDRKDARSVKVREKVFTISVYMRVIATKIIKEKHLNIEKAKVEFVTVHPNISKTVAGRCIRSGKEFKSFTELDYLVVQNEKTGDWSYMIRKHEIEDFISINKAHGVDWLERVKLKINSTYDLSPNEEDNLAI